MLTHTLLPQVGLVMEGEGCLYRRERFRLFKVNLHGMSFVFMWAFVNIRQAVASHFLPKRTLASCPEVRS